MNTALRESTTVLAPFDKDVALQSDDLPGFDSRDPADRFLVATALVQRLTLATADRAMHGFEQVETVW